MPGQILKIYAMSREAKDATRHRADELHVEGHRNWTNLSVFVILALTMMAALAGLGVLLFLLIDQLLSILH